MEYDLPTLRALLERVEAATGPDRELNKHLFMALLGGRFVRVPRFTSQTLDAQMLLSCVLPGWTVSLPRDGRQLCVVRHFDDPGKVYEAKIKRKVLSLPFGYELERTLPALALLAAMLRALIAQQEGRDG